MIRHHGLAWDLGDPPGTVGVRVPDHPLVRAVAEQVGPLATTSANRHGQPTPPEAAGAAASLAKPPDLVIDDGPCVGVASTVVDVTGPSPVMLREGPISEAEVRQALSG
jgi:tRNA A37 threonylcarbamoyladenosine synthetase subunit TsaC/SUA5/YrdC